LLLVIFNIKFERYCYLQESDAHIALLQYSGMSLVGVLHWDNRTWSSRSDPNCSFRIC